MTGKTIQVLIAGLIVIVFLYFGLAIYFPSYREGWINGKTSKAIEYMLHYALLRDANPESSLSNIDIDPFTGRPFLIIEDNESNGNRKWYMVSPGPDRKLNMDIADGVQMKEYVPYDPTNGIVSSGDILFGANLIPKIRSHLSSRQGNWESTYYGFERR